MTELAEIRRRLVQNPWDHGALNAFSMAAWARDTPAAAQAALRAFLSGPRDRRHTFNALLALRQLGRLSDVPRWLPRKQVRLPPAERHTVDFAPLVETYQHLLAETNRRRGEAWAPSSIESAKFSTPLTVDHLMRFRRSEVASGTQQAPDRPLDFPLLDFTALYPDVTPQEIADWIPQLREQRAGMLFRLARIAATYPYNADMGRALDLYDALATDDGRFDVRLFSIPELGSVTSKSLLAAYYACRIYPLVRSGGSILEIGGGFGAVAARVMRARPDVVYMLTDLPVNLILTYTYLRSHFGDAVYGAFEGPIRPPKGTRALIIPPWRLTELKGRASLVFNSMSFQHMDTRNHAFYGEIMRLYQARRLYHVNRQIVAPNDRTAEVPARFYSFLEQFSIVEDEEMDGRWIEVVADRLPDV